MKHVLVHLLFVIASCGFVTKEALAQCLTGYEDIMFGVFQEARFSGEKQVCDRDIDLENKKEGAIRFIRESSHPDYPQNSLVILEVKSDGKPLRRILHAGIFFGEYEEEEFNDFGGHVRVSSAFLSEAPTGIAAPVEVQLVEGIEEYVWKDRVVQHVKRLQRFVEIDRSGSKKELSDWRASVAFRRIVSLQVKDVREKSTLEKGTGEKSTGPDVKPYTIESYYYDPVLKRYRFFRKFRSTGDVQQTALQFVSAESGHTNLALLKVLDEGQVLKTLEVEDPKQNDLLLKLDVH